MNKKIIVGSIIAVAILLLMPSIPAIQQITIENRAYSGLIEELDFKDVKEIKELKEIRHPSLFALISFLAILRFQHLLILLEIAVDIDFYGEFPSIEIKHPILLLRALWLGMTLELWGLFWNNISNKLEWNWDRVLPY